MTQRLAAPSASELERILDEVAGIRFDGLHFPIRTLGDPMACPASHLPWLAWALSVDEWSHEWPVEARRAAVAASIEVHRHKGTPFAVRTALEAIGFEEARIREGFPISRHDGQVSHSGAETYGGGNRWAMFALTLRLAPWRALDGQTVGRVISAVERVKPARSHLVDIAFAIGEEDVVTTGEAAEIEVAQAGSDVLPWGTRYDGVRHHDSADRLIHNAGARHDGATLYAGWQGVTGRHDTVWLEHDVTIRTDRTEQAGVAPHYDGRFRHREITHGEGQPVAIDADMPLRLTRHRAYDGRHRHAGAIFDGATTHDGALPYWSGIDHRGAAETELAAA